MTSANQDPDTVVREIRRLSGDPTIPSGAQLAASIRAGGRTCRVCGCTQDRACITQAGPCHWVEWDLCSACQGKG